MNVQPASAEDLGAVRALLRACELPESDLNAAGMIDFLTARADDGALIACVGHEREGDAGLLRSLAVNPAMRNRAWQQAATSNGIACLGDRSAPHISADHERVGILHRQGLQRLCKK